VTGYLLIFNRQGRQERQEKQDTNKEAQAMTRKS